VASHNYMTLICRFIASFCTLPQNSCCCHCWSTATVVVIVIVVGCCCFCLWWNYIVSHVVVM